MSIEAISPVAVDLPVSRAIELNGTTPNFMEAISTHVERVEGSLRAAEGQLADLAAGKDVAVHDVMITMEQARTNMMFLVEARNRMVEAYQELTRMQL